MRLRLLLVAAFGQAMSQFLTDAGGLSPSVDAIDVAGNWPALPLAGLDDSAGYLASQPDYLTAQRDPIQPLPPDQVDSVKFAPESDIDPIIADDCASPSLPVPRTKGKLLRERQNVKKQCPNPMPLLTGPTSGSAGSAPDNKKPNENPRLYPGGQKRRLSDWFFGTQQEWKQCPPEKKTLCCTGAQEGELVRSCAYFSIIPGGLITSAQCFTGGIYCCDDLVISDRVINYHGERAIFDRDGKNCWPLFYRPPP